MAQSAGEPETRHDDPAARSIVPVVDELRGVRRRARVLLLGQRACAVAGLALACVLAMGILDFVLRFPAWVRGVTLIVGLTALIWAVLFRVLPALRFRPSLTDVALRIESARPELKGLLASGVEFGRERGAQGGEVSQALARMVSQRAGSEWARLGGFAVARDVLLTKPAAKATALFAAILLVMAGGLALQPRLAITGASRVLLPWSGAQWPRRTHVVDVTGLDFHPLGKALALRAAVTRSPSPWESTDVAVRYRTITRVAGQERVGPERRELLTWQERAVPVRGQDLDEVTPEAAREGALFERLIEPTADAVEYSFETSDDTTRWKRVELIPPPEVISAMAVIAPPGYAAQAGLDSAPREIDMGPGTDERAVAPATLAGSVVRMTVRLNKPVVVPDSVREALAGVEGPDGGPAVIESTGETWELSWRLSDSLRLPLALRDTWKVESVDEAVYRFEAIEDRVASATIVEPASNRTVLPTARLIVRAEGRDDVGLDRVWLTRQVFRPAGAPGREPSGPGGAMDPVADAAEMASVDPESHREAMIEAALDIVEFDARPGDEIRLVAYAADLLAAAGDGSRITASSERVLTVISAAEFIDEVQRQLSEVRRTAMRIEEQQREVRESAQERAGDDTLTRAQGKVSERLGALDRAVQDLGDRVEENGLNDQTLRDLLDRAEQAVERSGQASAQAAEALQRAAGERAERGEQSEQTPPDEQTAREVEEAQEQVQQELEDLISMLDEGKDTWAVRNALRNAAEQQRALAQQTREAGERAAGREADELSTAERAELERIESEQRQLADSVRQAIEQMRQTAEQMRASDPAGAQGLQQAERRAQDERTEEQMREAAQQAGENQTGEAQRNMEEAAEDLEQMLEDLDAGNRARDEVLRRMLASVMDSLRELVRVQEQEITRLGDAEQAENYAGLDAGMIALNRNTLGVLETVNAAGRELAPVASAVGKAADAQSRAIGFLRAQPVNPTAVREEEARSLELLRQALEKSEEADRRLEEEQQRRAIAELRKAYRDALEEQVAIRRETESYAALENLSRRDRLLLNKLGERQQALRDALQKILDERPEILEAGVFTYAHERMETLSRRAEGALFDAKPASALAPEDEVAGLLRGMIEALSDAQSDQPFSEGGSQDGGGGGGGGPQGEQQNLIPPAQELRLLRLIQQGIAERTAALDAMGAQAPADAIESVGESQESLLDTARKLIDKLNEQDGGAQVPGMDGAPPEVPGEAQPGGEAPEGGES